MIERIDISLFEKHLAGELEKDQLLDLDGNVLSEAQVDKALAEYQELMMNLEGAALKAQLKERYAGQAGRTRYLQPKVWLTAAAVLLLATVGFLWQRANEGPQFDDYFTPFKQLDSFRGSSSQYAEAMEAYARGHYEEAYKRLKQITEPDNEVNFFMGVSALALGKSHEAIVALERSGLHEGNRYYQQVRWYLALAWWQGGDVAKARSLLEDIQEGEDLYDKAQELLELLEPV